MAQLDFTTLRRADEREVSVHELRRYAAGELDEARRGVIEALLQTDAALKAELDELEAERRAFQTALPFGRFEMEQKERARGSGPIFAHLFSMKWTAALGGLAVAATLAVFIMLPSELDPPSDPVQRWANQTKGADVQLGFFVRVRDGIRLGTDGESLGSGAQIQFAVVDAKEAQAMVIVGVDGKGAVSTYATRAITGREKGASKARLLEQSLVLDDAIGPERFFVVYGAGPVGGLQQQVEEAARALVKAGDDLASTTQLPLEGEYLQGSVHIVKVR